jgi:hypothetical protein
MRVQGNLPLGIPGAEMPKHQTLTWLYHFGVSQVGISRHAKTRKLSLGFPWLPKLETPKLIHVRLFWGFTIFPTLQGNLPFILGAKISNLYHFGDFASQDFTTCEDKETHPWVSRLPKLRNTKTEGTILSGARFPNLGHKILQRILG